MKARNLEDDHGKAEGGMEEDVPEDIAKAVTDPVNHPAKAVWVSYLPYLQ